MNPHHCHHITTDSMVCNIYGEGLDYYHLFTELVMWSRKKGSLLDRRNFFNDFAMLFRIKMFALDQQGKYIHSSDHYPTNFGYKLTN